VLLVYQSFSYPSDHAHIFILVKMSISVILRYQQPYYVLSFGSQIAYLRQSTLPAFDRLLVVEAVGQRKILMGQIVQHQIRWSNHYLARYLVWLTYRQQDRIARILCVLRADQPSVQNSTLESSIGSDYYYDADFNFHHYPLVYNQQTKRCLLVCQPTEKNDMLEENTILSTKRT